MDNRFDTEKFRTLTGTGWLGSELLYLPETESTNNWLKLADRDRLSHGMVVITDNQTTGRGQYHRQWISEPGQNLTFSLLFFPSAGDRMMLLTIAMITEIGSVVEELTGLSCSVKWPNDLIINHKKAGGVLTECLFLGSKPERVIVGTGLNVNQTGFNKDLSRTATSLAIETGETFDREALLAKILLRTEQVYARWHKQEKGLAEEVSRKLIGYGEWVRVSVNGEQLNGLNKFLGINEKGECLMLNEELDVNTFSHEQIRIIPGSSGVQKAG